MLLFQIFVAISTLRLLEQASAPGAVIGDTKAPKAPCNLWSGDAAAHPQGLTWDVSTRSISTNEHSCGLDLASRTAAMACLTRRSIACVGDSQLRDLCFGLARFLNGDSVHDAGTEKAADHLRSSQGAGNLLRDAPGFNNGLGPTTIDTHMASFPSNFVGSVFDHGEVTNASWSVDLYHTITQTTHWGKLEDVVFGRGFRSSYDVVLVNIGLHEISMDRQGTKWYTKDVMQSFDKLVRSAKRQLGQLPLVVWIPMNRQCQALCQKYPRQPGRVAEANKIAAQYLRPRALPFLNLDLLFGSGSSCACMADCAHAQSWVDHVRSQVVLNHLCAKLERQNWSRCFLSPTVSQSG